MKPIFKPIYIHFFFIAIIMLLVFQGGYYERKKELFENDIVHHSKLVILEEKDLDDKILKRKMLVLRLQAIRNDLIKPNE